MSLVDVEITEIDDTSVPGRRRVVADVKGGGRVVFSVPKGTKIALGAKHQLRFDDAARGTP